MKVSSTYGGDPAQICQQMLWYVTARGKDAERVKLLSLLVSITV